MEREREREGEGERGRDAGGVAGEIQGKSEREEKRQ